MGLLQDSARMETMENNKKSYQNQPVACSLRVQVQESGGIAACRAFKAASQKAGEHAQECHT
jgi:hypothetical protein